MSGPFGNLGNAAKLLEELKTKIEKMKEEAGAVRVEGTAGGGMVKAVANGRFEILSVTIEPGILNPGERELTQDLVAAAVNAALTKAQAEMKNRLGQQLGLFGLPLPGIPGFTN